MEELDVKLDRKLTVRLKVEDYELLEELSKAEGLKPSQVVRSLVLKFLNFKKRESFSSL